MSKRQSSFKILTDLSTATVSLEVRGNVIGTFCIADGQPASRNNLAAALHGYKQKIADAGAKSADTVTGKVPEQDKIDSVVNMFTRMAAGGDWTIARGGSSSSSLTDDAILVAALQLARPKTPIDSITTIVKGLTKAQKEFMLYGVEGNSLRPYVDKVRAERAAVSGVEVSLDDLFADSDDEGLADSDDSTDDDLFADSDDSTEEGLANG